MAMAAENPSHCRFGRPLKIKQTRDSSIDGLDFISSLPDEILHHVFSFIPTDLAITTSVLSKRWRLVWSQTPCLFFERVYASCESINKTLASYSAEKIMSFHLKTVLAEKTHLVNTMIEFAVSHKVEKLTLKFDQILTTDYSFPDCFFNNLSLKQLSVHVFFLSMILSCTTVSWTSLKSLSLRYVRFSDESFLQIISGCPMLESLRLKYCDSFQCLDLSKSLRLSRLDIDCSPWVQKPMQIMAPYIRYLRLRNSEALCTLVDVSSVVEADLDTCHFFNHTKWTEADFSDADPLQVMVQEMLEMLQNVEKLTVGMDFLHILSLSELSGAPLPMLKVKTLILETKLSRSVVPGIARLVQSSLGLKKITVYTIEQSTVLDEFVNVYVESQEWKLEVDVAAFLIRLRHCKVVDRKLVASLMELLMAKSTTLDTLVVYSSGFSGNRFQMARHNNILVELL